MDNSALTARQLRTCPYPTSIPTLCPTLSTLVRHSSHVFPTVLHSMPNLVIFTGDQSYLSPFTLLCLSLPQSTDTSPVLQSKPVASCLHFHKILSTVTLRSDSIVTICLSGICLSVEPFISLDVLFCPPLVLSDLCITEE